MENIKIVELIGEIKNNNKWLAIDVDSFTYYSDSDYICDIIAELADSNIDLYTSDLLEWLKDNYNVVEDANKEFGAPNDIIKQCQQGQFYQYNNEIYENLSDYIQLYAFDYILNNLKIEEITKKQQEEIEEELTYIDNNNILNDITDLIYNILNK
ncbi:MAG TPA: hypothetical protein VFC60_00035 [Tissierellaceae bacterium]|nr:hypothetical protein [Tissierellaceae bacterium]